jgi:hypothetical protein
MTNQIIIEIMGGVLTEVYTDIKHCKVILIDWDNIYSGGEVEYLGPAKISDMPKEASRLLVK